MVRFTSDLTWRHQFQLVNIDLVTTACQDCQQLLFYKFHKELELLCKPYVPCTKVFSVSMKMMATDKTSVSKHSVGGVVIGLKSIKNDIGQRYLAKFDKSNVAEAWFFFGLSMVLLLKSDCPISIFNGLGGHQLSFFSLGQ